ncbi:MAG: hypothetical protein JWM78_1800 [Verrucomicrobiaceae bacterium]|nr:hypothetical protein [Verrucomicrobiaceae bacterium]
MKWIPLLLVIVTLVGLMDMRRGAESDAPRTVASLIR